MQQSQYSTHGERANNFYETGPKYVQVRVQIDTSGEGALEASTQKDDQYSYLTMDFPDMQAFEEFADYINRFRKVMQIK